MYIHTELKLIASLNVLFIPPTQIIWNITRKVFILSNKLYPLKLWEVFLKVVDNYCI